MRVRVRVRASLEAAAKRASLGDVETIEETSFLRAGPARSVDGDVALRGKPVEGHRGAGRERERVSE